MILRMSCKRLWVSRRVRGLTLWDGTLTCIGAWQAQNWNPKGE
jgi:hypothetical protein